MYKELVWNNADKSSWGEGEWQNEADKIQFVDEETGYDCLVVRSKVSGALCGYVGVEEAHPAFGRTGNWDDEVTKNLSVHGGITFGDFCMETDDPAILVCHVPFEGRAEKIWWLGFDCMHGSDVGPKLDVELNAVLPFRRSMEEFSTYKNMEYVRNEIKSLAKQLKELETNVPRS